MIRRDLRLGPLVVRGDVESVRVLESLERALRGTATLAGPTGARDTVIEWRQARRTPARRRGLVVLGRFGDGEWRVRYAGRFVRWRASGEDLRRVRVALALSGDPAEDGFAVRSFLRFLIAETLVRTGGVALHAGAVARPEGAAVFLAKSGGGKTTLVRRFGRDGGLGDDFVVVARDGGRFVVFPSPVAGREGTAVRGRTAPLWRLCDLVKGKATRVEAMRGPEQVAAILRRAVLFSRDLETRRALLDTALGLVREVGVVRLYQSLDTPPWEALRDA